MTKCLMCGKQINRPKDFYITINERKGPSVDACSLECTTTYIEDRA